MVIKRHRMIILFWSNTQHHIMIKRHVNHQRSKLLLV